MESVIEEIKALKPCGRKGNDTHQKSFQMGYNAALRKVQEIIEKKEKCES